MQIASLALLLLPLLAPTPSGGPTTAPPDHLSEVLAFPTPSEPLVIETCTISKLLGSYAGATGQHIVMNDDSRRFGDADFLELARPMTVPPEDVQAVVESLLVERGFVLRVLHAANPRLLAVASLETGARATMRSTATFVPSDRRDVLRAHPAMLFTTAVHLPRTDVRQVTNSLRTILTDANRQSMLPAGATNTVVLTGLGHQVADWVEMMARIDVASATVPAPDTSQIEAAGDE